MALEGSLSSSDTGTLNARLHQAEERVQFNSDNIDDVWESFEKMDTEMGDMEDELSAWMERELSKVYNIINDNPLGN